MTNVTIGVMKAWKPNRIYYKYEDGTLVVTKITRVTHANLPFVRLHLQLEKMALASRLHYCENNSETEG
jgi:hypothetical protein